MFEYEHHIKASYRRRTIGSNKIANGREPGNTQDRIVQKTMRAMGLAIPIRGFERHELPGCPQKACPAGENRIAGIASRLRTERKQTENDSSLGA